MKRKMIALLLSLTLLISGCGVMDNESETIDLHGKLHGLMIIHTFMRHKIILQTVTNGLKLMSIRYSSLLQ